MLLNTKWQAFHIFTELIFCEEKQQQIVDILPWDSHSFAMANILLLLKLITFLDFPCVFFGQNNIIHEIWNIML